MKKRIIHISLCFASLCIGGGIYVLLRPNTYVSQFVRQLSPITTNLCSNAEAINSHFIKYYLPDLLWSFSLHCGLNTLFDTKKSILINGIIVLIIGTLWEFAQYKNKISGTGDFVDILMYGIGVAIILIPNLIIKNEQKE